MPPAAKTDALQPAFRALADPARRRILTDLATSDLTVGDVASRFAMTRVAVRKHIAVLEDGGLVEVRAVGRRRLVSLRPERLRAAHDWIGRFSRFWDERLGALKDAVEKGDDR